MTEARIEGKVSELLNERELVINIGGESGVKRGMRFAVLAATPLLIRDPETGRELGHLDREKIRVEVTEVEPLFSVCMTYEKTVVGSGFGLDLASVAMMQPRRETFRTLKLSDSSVLPPLSEEESIIKRGDRVKQISETTATRNP